MLLPKLRRAFLIRRAIVLVWQAAPQWTLASIALVGVQSVLPLASLYLLKLVIDSVTQNATTHAGAFESMVWLIAALGGVTLLGAIAQSLATLVGEAQSQNVTDYMQNIMHAQSIKVDLAYYENARYYDTLHRAQQEAGYRPTRIVAGLVSVAQSGLTLAALATLLLSLHWIVALILFAAAVPGALVRLQYSNKLYRWQRERTTLERLSWYLHSILINDNGAKEIRLFDLGASLMQRYREVRQQLRHERIRLAWSRSFIDLVAQSASALAIFGAYLFIAYQTLQGAITLGDLVMYYQAFQRGQAYLREILGGLTGLYEDTLFLQNLYEFLDITPRVIDPPAPRAIPVTPQRGIVLDHVHFQYPDSARHALIDISLTIQPGQHIALVGENGSGKTTLIKLLCRLYDPTSGAISFDGIDLREFAIAQWRRQIAVVFQDYARYHLTARENIRFGNITLAENDARVENAAHASGADAVIARLPQGYDTTLGKWFGGEELSVGEWQKIALARAFVRDAPVLVLDEPTSSLDAESEYAVFQRFRELTRGRTAILISHRFSTVRMADTIYVLDAGRIIDSGSHDELMRQGGKYARLFELQAGNYR